MPERKPDTLEPLLIPTLRLLIALPLAVSVLPLLLGVVLPTLLPTVTFGVELLPDKAFPVGLPFVAAELIALLLLVIPGLPARLGKYFLPLTLFFCTLGPVGTLAVHSMQLAAAPLPDTLPLQLPGFGAQGVWPITFFLTIPLIVVAWQYSFRAVVWYSLGLALIDVAAAGWLLAAGNSQAGWVLLQFSFGRMGVFLANGYLVSQLVAGQRQQRRALAQANSRLIQQASTQEQLAVSRERNRLARDLHDTLAHYSAILSNLSVKDRTQAVVTAIRHGLIHT